MGDVSNSLAESWYFLQSLAWQQAPVGPDMVVCCYELYHWQGRGPTPTKVTLSLLVILVSDATNEKLQQTKHTEILQLHHNNLRGLTGSQSSKGTLSILFLLSSHLKLH